MKIAACLRNPKKWWPLGLFILCGIAVSFFQNCSNVAFTNSGAQLNAQDIPDTPNLPAHFPTSPPVAPLCTNISQNIQPVLDWDWYSQLGANDYHSFNQVMASPVVGDLAGDGHPSIVFVSWSNNVADLFSQDPTVANYSKNGVLRIVDGATGVNKVSVGTQAAAPLSSTTPLLVDLDNDGKLEIVYMNYDMTKVIALNYDGSFRWSWALPRTMTDDCFGGLAASDFDLNGRAEVIVGPYVLEENAQNQPVIKMNVNPNSLRVSCNSFATVLDPSHPHFSLVDMTNVYDNTGTMQFSIGTDYGLIAVGKVRSDLPSNQIVKMAGQHMRIYDGISGTLLNDANLLALSQYTCPDGSIGGGPPSIGDFMGNGTLQIAVATGQYLMIFDGNGNLLTASRTRDCSSEATGVTAFDFDGDGKPEIIYGDEEYLRIFHVVNGQLTVIAQIVNPSGTLLEYPVVADITGDGSAKLVVVSNNYPVVGNPAWYDVPDDGVTALNVTGVRSFKSGDGLPWMPTRAMWNQYNYNASLMNDKGRVYDPAVSSQSWLGRTFKLNSQVTMSQPICQN